MTRTKTVLAVCFAMMTFKNFGTSSVEISSKVELDSDENEESITAAFDEINPNKPADLSVSISPKQTLLDRYHENELVKPRESRKRRIYTSHEDSSSQPKVINNIHIIVNGNESMPSTNSCKHGVCNVSVSSKLDGKGNIVTEVRLSIITKVKSDIQIDDIPIIDGFRGIDEDQDEQPGFHSINAQNSVYSNLHRNNIPQIQSNYDETWYRPQTYWNYHHFGNRYNVRFRGYKASSYDRPMVDDKIEPPLSKTKSAMT